MLVCPQAWDQHGNAARVVYHGLGERVLEEHPSAETLSSTILKLLSDPSYKKKASTMKDSLRTEEPNDTDLKFIDRVLASECDMFMSEAFAEIESQIARNLLGASDS